MKILLGLDLICEEDCTYEWIYEEDRTCEEGFEGVGYVGTEGLRRNWAVRNSSLICSSTS